jgi:hypothetical protein
MDDWEKRRGLCGSACFAALVLFVGDLAFADTYQWVDKNGSLGFADSIEKVPPQYRRSAKKIAKTPAAKDAPDRPARTTPPAQVPAPSAPEPEVSSEDLAFDFQARYQRAQGELAQLKAARERTQKEYDTLRAEFYARSFADPKADAKLRAQLADLDDRIQKKQYEIATTIPDEARRAGVPTSELTR